MRKTFGRKRFGNRAARPALTWSDVSAQWTMAAVAATTNVVLIQLQSPTSLAALTSDPPEDMTILRMVGDFAVTLAGSGSWSLALTVADVTWTPGGQIAVDNDKRILWQMTYQGGAAVRSWEPPGHVLDAGALVAGAPAGATHIDISPKVRIEPGKALYLVAYENNGATTFTTSSLTMRVLYKRSGRR